MIPYDRLLVSQRGPSYSARHSRPGSAGSFHGSGPWNILKPCSRCSGRECGWSVIGSGLVGIKTAQALAHRGYEVTLVARKSQVLSNLLDETAAALLHQALTGIGVKIRFHATPAAISGENGRVKSVVLTDGSEIPADLVIIGIGVIPNTEFLDGAGLSNPSGLTVNQHLRTAQEDIFAAGDCVQPFDRLSGEKTYFAIWPAAVEQGRLAGANMAGHERIYGGLVIAKYPVCRRYQGYCRWSDTTGRGTCEVHSHHDPVKPELSPLDHSRRPPGGRHPGGAGGGCRGLFKSDLQPYASGQPPGRPPPPGFSGWAAAGLINRFFICHSEPLKNLDLASSLASFTSKLG